MKALPPASVKVKVKPHHGGTAYVTPIDSLGYRAASAAYEDTFGKTPIPQRSGGSIPIVALFEKELNSKSILMGFGLIAMRFTHLMSILVYGTTLKVLRPFLISTNILLQ
ncbi:acetylornithine deacetylase [Nonlabens ulvanivorans]|nr:acetylornithine deacetylase [Nonlabens ulvanivorans]